MPTGRNAGDTQRSLKRHRHERGRADHPQVPRSVWNNPRGQLQEQGFVEMMMVCTKDFSLGEKGTSLVVAVCGRGGVKEVALEEHLLVDRPGPVLEWKTPSLFAAFGSSLSSFTPFSSALASLTPVERYEATLRMLLSF